MRHMTFASFDDRARAAAVAGEIARGRDTFGRCELIVHAGAFDDDEASFGETDVLRWLGWGVAWGVLAGGAVGVVMGALLLTGVGPVVAGLLGACAGGLWAGLNGALTGTTGPRRDLARAAAQAGSEGAVVSVVTHDVVARDRVVAHITERGGRLAHTTAAPLGARRRAA